MSLTVAIILILGFFIIYITVIDVFTALFKATGLTKEKARFQAVSLFTNAGFTTGESEIITRNPVRRKYALIIMIIGHIFSVLIVSLVVAIFGTIKFTDIKKDIIAPAIIFGSFIVLFILFKLPFISRPFNAFLEKHAVNSFLKRENDNIITILDNYGKSSIVEVYLHRMPTVLKDKPLFETNLKGNYDINLLIVKRKDKVLNITKDTILQEKDTIVAFGPLINFRDLFLKHQEKEIEVVKSKMNNVEIIDNFEKDAMCEIEIKNLPDSLKDTRLEDSNIKTKWKINIIILKRNGNIKPISKDTIFEEDDTIIVYGPYQNIKDVFINMCN